MLFMIIERFADNDMVPGLGVSLEIVPVVPSKETQAVVAPYLEPPAAKRG